MSSFDIVLPSRDRLATRSDEQNLIGALGRFLTYRGQFDEADLCLNEAEKIASRLSLESVLLNCQAARGRWLSDSGRSDARAVNLLRQVAATLYASDERPLFAKADLFQPDGGSTAVKGRRPILCRVLLDLNRAARFAGDSEAIEQSLKELDSLTDIYSGYCPHYYLSWAECILRYAPLEEHKLAEDLIRRARQMGASNHNPWVAQAAEALETEFGINA
jgi:hypothetical protein